MSELDTFVAAILTGDLDSAGALADWCDEHDDPRGILLRRRWKRWRADREKERAKIADNEANITQPMLNAVESLRKAGFTVEATVHVKLSEVKLRDVDALFRRYIQSRFPKGLSLRKLS